MIDGARARQAKIGGALGVILAAQLFLFMPFTLYSGNAGDFTVPFSAAAGFWWPLALQLAGIVALIAFLLPAAACRLYLCLLAAVSILMWVQGNLLVWDYGPLDGRDIEWGEYAWRGWLDLGLWLAALAAAVVAFRRLDKPLVRAAVALFALQAALFTFTFVQAVAGEAEQADGAKVASLEDIMRFSSGRNVVHIIADGFQADIFDEIIREQGEGERLRSALDGFTFFPGHLGLFPYTHMTIPAFLSGKVYRNDQLREAFMEDTVGGRNILSEARDAGFEVDAVVPSGAVAKIYAHGRYTHFYPVSGEHLDESASPEYGAAAMLLDLTLFRVTPHFLKKRVYNDQLWLVQSLVADKKHTRLGFFSHSRLLESMAAEMSADRPKPVYKLIHLMLSHKPFVSTARCTYAGGVRPVVRDSVRDQARCALGEIVELLEGMKRLGIYDDAAIVIMGDHGAWVPPKGGFAIVNPDGRTADYIHPQVIALSMPLLAVKRPGDSGPLKVSDAQSWIVDTAATIADAAGIDAEFDGESVFDLEEGAPRERRFNYYRYSKSELNDDYIAPIEEFVITGKPAESPSWRYAVTHHPGGRSEVSQHKSRVWRTVTLQ